MSENFEKMPSFEKKENKFPSLDFTSIDELVERLRDNQEAQIKAFGKVLTEEEFAERFPKNSISSKDLRRAMLALGIEMPTEEQLKKIIEEANKLEQE